MDTLLQDLRFAARSLLRRRTFTAVAVATIALATGAATSIFSVVDAVLFRSLPYSEPGRLVAVWQTYANWKKEPILSERWDRIPIDYTRFKEWRRQQRSFVSVGAWARTSLLLSGGAEPEQVIITRASPSLLETLGMTPILGRTFLPGEDVPGGPLLTMISYGNWQSRFGGRNDVIGRIVTLDDKPYTIIGVLPKGFVHDRGSPETPFWIPAGQRKDDVGQGNQSFRALARLKPGVPMEQAAAETSRLLRGDEPESKRSFRLAPYQREETREYRRPLLLLLGAVGLLLLTACVNIATLMLGEASAREQEMGARVALGATRRRLLAQLLTESVTLSLVGGVIGTALALAGTKLLVASAPQQIPGIRSVHVDARVLVASLLIAGGVGIVVGIFPALTMSRQGATLGLRGGGQSAAGRGRLQRLLVSMELALSVVMLVSASLLSRSLSKLSAVDPGFRPDGLIAIDLASPRSAYPTDAAARVAYSDIESRIASVPGIVGVTETNGVPFSGSYSSSGYSLPGEDATNRENWHEVQQRAVTPGYFEVTGMTLRAGRAFTAQDDAGHPLVAILSEAAARRDWPNESPIGKQVTYQGKTWTVVGIVADAKYIKLGKNDDPTIYTTASQREDVGSILIRVGGNETQVISRVRAIVREVAPSMAITRVERIDDLIERSFAEERFRTVLLGLFAVMACVLAAVGMFGVTSRSVGARTREIGIRVALGATGGSVVRMIVLNTLVGVGVGMALGLVGSMGASRLLEPFLYGVTSLDPATYVSSFALLALVSIAASWLPARRVARVEPSIVLRGE
jgi:putative ABC transport system permease protein